MILPITAIVHFMVLYLFILQDYDYAYDYSEMTIKPQNGTTPKPLNVTYSTINNETQHNDTTSSLLVEQSTEAIRSSTAVAVEVTEVSLNQTANNYVVTTVQTTADAPTTISSDSSNVLNTTALPTANKCRRGFAQNNEGKCEYKVHGTSNA